MWDEGVGCRFQGFGAQGLGFEVWVEGHTSCTEISVIAVTPGRFETDTYARPGGLRFRVQGLGLGVEGVELRVWGRELRAAGVG